MPAAPVIRLLRDRGVLVGSSSHERTLRLMPPLNTPPEALDEFFRIFRGVLLQAGEETEG